jgi:hypothetical protein
MIGRITRVAALYDIHGNLPALEAVLEEVRGARVDRVVVGGARRPRCSRSSAGPNRGSSGAGPGAERG